MDIVLRNFFRILSSGPFANKEPLEPMSSFKWHRLYQMVEVQNVKDVFSCGVKQHIKDVGLNIPNDLISQVDAEASYHPYFQEILSSHISMSVGFLDGRFQNILNNRPSSDTSAETIDVLKLMVFNEQNFLNHGINMNGIILLGCYLRERGDAVDFVKLEKLLDQLFLRRMAQLQGNILISVFGFEVEELPFVHHKESEAFKLVVSSVKNLAYDTAQEWHFRQTRTGFVRNNSALLRRNMHRSMRYIPYAPLETVCSFFKNFILSLKEIEE